MRQSRRPADVIPSSNPAALRTALAAAHRGDPRGARQRQLNGFILTSNGNRADLDRLVAEAGADGVTIIKLTEAEACARVSALVPAGARREACRGRVSSGAGLGAISLRRETWRSTHENE